VRAREERKRRRRFVTWAIGGEGGKERVRGGEEVCHVGYWSEEGGEGVTEYLSPKKKKKEDTTGYSHVVSNQSTKPVLTRDREKKKRRIPHWLFPRCLQPQY
jgi:hypothetical protein